MAKTFEFDYGPKTSDIDQHRQNLKYFDYQRDMKAGNVSAPGKIMTAKDLQFGPVQSPPQAYYAPDGQAASLVPGGIPGVSGNAAEDAYLKAQEAYANNLKQGSWQNWAGLGLGAVATGANIYGMLASNKENKKNNKFNRRLSSAQHLNSMKSYNNTLANRTTNEEIMQGLDKGALKDQYDKRKLS